MGMDFKVNEYGEIIRDNKGKEPQKSNKKWKYLFILLVLVIMGFLLNNYFHSYLSDSANYNPPASVQSSLSSSEVFLNGYIGNSLSVKMYLRYDGNNSYSGWYYYLKNGPNNKLTLRGTVTNDSLRLDEYSLRLDEYNVSGEKTGTFEGIFNGSSYRGNLYVYHSNKNFKFSLYE